MGIAEVFGALFRRFFGGLATAFSGAGNVEDALSTRALLAAKHQARLHRGDSRGQWLEPSPINCKAAGHLRRLSPDEASEPRRSLAVLEPPPEPHRQQD